MKTKKPLLALSFILFLAGCVKEFNIGNLNENQTGIADENGSAVTIKGNYAIGYTDNETRAASIEDISIGDSILFYSTGGVKANGEILKYENGEWTGLKDNKWYVEDGPANIVAFHPIINGANELYDENGELKDIVCCKDTFNTLKTINLTFNHIFAKFVINIDKGLNDTIKKVYIKIPQKINNIDFSTGEYTTENNNSLVGQEKNEYGKYDFFIPCKKEMTLSLIIECNNTTLEEITIKENMSFKSGFEYICNIRKNSENGIYTKEDFIAFTHLINGETEYNGIRIEDLYTEINGKRVFNLYNDLSFTEEEADEMASIKEFNDILDGNNHTLSNFKIKKTTGGMNPSIIGEVTNTACIKNLKIKNSIFNLPDYNSYTMASLFVSKNFGIIDNCHLTGGVIHMSTTKNNNNYAGFAISNMGNIINSSVSNLQVESNNGVLGIFVFQNNGNIFNCRINNNINKDATGSNSSTICVNNELRLYNIFVSEYKKDYYGICHTNKVGHYYNCMLPENYKGKAIYSDFESQTALKKAVYYSESPDEYTRIANELNQWIEDNKSKYPDITFRKWKTDPTEKVIFE